MAKEPTKGSDPPSQITGAASPSIPRRAASRSAVRFFGGSSATRGPEGSLETGDPTSGPGKDDRSNVARRTLWVDTPVRAATSALVSPLDRSRAISARFSSVSLVISAPDRSRV